MSEIKGIHDFIKVNQKAEKKDQPRLTGESKFNEELQKSLDMMEKMGTDIEIAKMNFSSGPSDIANLKDSVFELNKYIGKIQDTIEQLKPDAEDTASSPKTTYGKAAQLYKKNTPDGDA